MTAQPPIYLRLNPADNVVVARTDILPGTAVEKVKTTGTVPAGHKIATVPIKQGALSPVIMPEIYSTPLLKSLAFPQGNIAPHLPMD